jgi:hypothetical protein
MIDKEFDLFIDLRNWVLDYGFPDDDLASIFGKIGIIAIRKFKDSNIHSVESIATKVELLQELTYPLNIEHDNPVIIRGIYRKKLLSLYFDKVSKNLLKNYLVNDLS